MAKSNSKSIRLSDEVLAYIEKSKGNGFNEKFENIILHAKEDEPRLQKQLNYLDEQITKKHVQLDTISQKVNSLDEQVNAIFSLSDQIHKIQKNMKKLVDDS